VAEFLDGNTLEYRALQADARNSSQPTVVKLSPSDYHALSILRGEEGRLYVDDDEPGVESDGTAPFSFAHGMGATVGSPGSDYSPPFQILQLDSWGYTTQRTVLPDSQQSQAVVPAGSPSTHQASPPTPDLSLSTPQTVLHGTAVYSLSMTSPVQTPYQQFDSPAVYYPAESPYDARGQSYFSHPPALVKADYPADATADGYFNYLPTHFTTLMISSGGGSADFNNNTYPLQEQQTTGSREILILHLPADCRSESAVLDLLARHTAVTVAGAGVRESVERLHLPVSKTGRPRGTAYVTFTSPDAALAAVEALDGRDVSGSGSNGVTLKAKVLDPSVEEGSAGRRGSGGGRSSSHHHQRSLGSGGSGGVGTEKGAAGALVKKGWSLKAAASLSSVAVSSSSSASSSGRNEKGEEDNKEKKKKAKEEPPVIVDGSGGRGKLHNVATPVVVDGSARKKGSSGGSGGRR
jgi:hypothetical protein